DVVGVTRIKPARYLRLCEVGVLLDQLVDDRALQRNELRVTSGHRVLNIRGRVADGIEESVNLVVAKRRAVLVCLQLGSERKVADAPAHGGKKLLHRGTRAGARIADIEALTFQVLERIDVRFSPREHGERLRMDREYGPQLPECTVLLKCARAFQGIVVDVGLHHAEV